MGVGRFTAKIEVFSIDDLTAIDRERLAGFIGRSRAGSAAGIERNGPTQAYFIGQEHNARVVERFAQLSQFTERLRFFDSLLKTTPECRRIELILERDGYAGKHLPEKIEKLCEYNGYFRQGCLDQTKSFYERLMLFKARDYLDSLLGPAEQALDNAPAYRPPDPARRL